MALKRRAHVLSGLNGELQRMRLLFFDVETHTKEETHNRLYQAFTLCTANLVSYRPGEQYKIIENYQSHHDNLFHEWFLSILRPKNNLRVITSNIWFDIRTSGLFMYLVQSGFSVKLFLNKGMTTIIKLHRKPYTITFLNIQQLIPGNVKKYGELVGLPKLDIHLDTKDKKALMVYCQRDTDIITRLIGQWLDFIYLNDLGRFALTLAGQAFTSYRTQYMRKKIFIHANDYITSFERNAYFGGRVEMLYQGSIAKQKIYKLDVNSMYPYVMRNNTMPVKWIKCIEYPSAPKILYYLQRYHCIAYVALNTDKPIYPVKYNKRLCFPTGRFLTFLSHPELEHAYINRYIEGIRYLIVYKKANIFKHFIDTFYSMRNKYREQNNPMFVFLTKRIMNSLYGKFGQRIDIEILEEEMTEEKYHNISVYDADTQKNLKELWIGKSRKILEESAADAHNTFVAIPANITSLARLHLWKLIEQAGINNVFYCDTDSIFTNEAGCHALQDSIHPTRLGALGIEKESDSLHIYGPKDYVFAGDVTLKGIRRDAEQLSPTRYKQIQFPTFRGDINHGLDKPYGIIKVEKELKRIYEKGVVGEDGRVTPWILAEY